MSIVSKYLGLALVLILFAVIVNPVQTGPLNVLGANDKVINVEIPNNEGPGLLLPDSPLYFLDVAKNNLKVLLVSYDSRQEAKMHLAVAGERIAEIKILLGKSNPAGLDASLASLVAHVNGAAESIQAARNKGMNVDQLAQELNTTVDRERESLAILAKITTQPLGLKLQSAEVSLAQSDATIENFLPKDLLANERKRELEKKTTEVAEQALQTKQEADAVASEAAKFAGAVSGAKDEKKSSESATKSSGH